MNKNVAIIGGALLLLIIVGLVVIIGNKNPTPTDTTVVINDETVVRTPAVPEAVTNASAFPSDTSVVMSGTVIPNGTPTRYWYEFGTTANLGSKTQNQLMGSGYVSIPAPTYITGLTKNTTYYFRLVANSELGTATGEKYTFKTTDGTPDPIGSVPTVKTLSATGITNTTSSVNGEVKPNLAPTQYWFEYGMSANLGETSTLQSIGDSDNTLSASASLSNLNPGTTYHFRLNAQNKFGTIIGTILTFKTLGSAVSAPSAVTKNALNISATDATLRGTVDPNGSETTYWFEYSSDSILGSVLLKTTPITSVGAGNNPISVESAISNLSSKTTYYQRVVAKSSEGTARGEIVSFKTK